MTVRSIHFVAVDAHIDRRKSFLSEEGVTDEIRDGWSYNSVADPSPLPSKAKISHRQRRYFILREQYFTCCQADFIAKLHLPSGRFHCNTFSVLTMLSSIAIGFQLLLYFDKWDAVGVIRYRVCTDFVVGDTNRHPCRQINLFCDKLSVDRVTASPLLLCHYVTFPLSEESQRPLQNELPYGMNWLRHELNYVHELHLWCIKTACGFPTLATYYLLLDTLFAD